MHLASPSAAFKPFLQLASAPVAGRISYGAYVFHEIMHGQITALVLYLGVRHPGFWVAAFALPFTLLLSWASYRRFESPFLV